jgi:YidC/Oxa1 family membrane protein insertase
MSELKSMEDKRTAFAVLLCMFLLMFWMEMVMAPYNRRPMPTPATPNNQQQTIPQASNVEGTQNQPIAKPNIQITNANSVAPTSSSSPNVGNPNAAQLKALGNIVVDSNDLQIIISNLGGRLSNVLLKNHKAHLGSDSPLDLVLMSETSALPLGISFGSLNDSFVEYHLVETSVNPTNTNKYTVPNNAPLQVKLKGTLQNSALQNAIEITKSFRFQPDSHLIDLDINLSQASPDGAKMWLEWTHFETSLTGSESHNPNWITTLSTANSITQMQLNQVNPQIMELGQSSWVSYGNKYFMAALVAPANTSNARTGRDGNVYYTRISGGDTASNFHIYLGPKNHSDLIKTGFQLERNVDLGWFAFVAHPLLAGIKFLYALLGNYGLAIILLTLIIKALFLPLTITSFNSMQAMQALQPEMKALRERIQDPNQLNKEVMALYKKHGVNPMGGCLPMLIQLPVFLGLYNALNYSIELRHAPFALWINDLSSPEKLQLMGVGIPVMVILMGASMFIQQMTTPSAMDPQQKKIMMLMPIVFTISFWIFPFPSGLVLYWLVNNLISIIQQMHIRSQKKGGALQGTVIASVVIFAMGYILTLI